MSAEKQVYLVRSGRHTGFGKLSREGRDDAHKARELLVAKNLGSNALILCSFAPADLHTAAIIGEGLDRRPAPSIRVDVNGREPRAIQSLDTWIGQTLKERKIDSSYEALVIVAHAALLATAKYGSAKIDNVNKVSYGEVYEYTPESWTNPDYSARIALRDNLKIAALRELEPPQLK